MIDDRLFREVDLLKRISTIFFRESPRIALDTIEPIPALDLIVREIASETRVDAATIFLRDASAPAAPGAESLFVIRATHGLDPACVGVTRIHVGEGIAGAAIQERQIVRAADGRADPRYVLKAETGEDRFRGILAAPIQREEEAVGILVLHFREERVASEDEIRLIAAIAEQIGFAVENARLSTELAERTSARLAMHEMTRALSGLLDRKTVLDRIIAESFRVIPSRAAFLRTLDLADLKLRVEAIAGDPAGFERAIGATALDASPAGHAAATSQSLVIADLAADSAASLYPGAANLLVVPLMHGGQVLGTIELVDRRDGRGAIHRAGFTEGDVRLLGILAQTAVTAWDRADAYVEMEAMALTFKRRNHELTLLHRISREIQGCISVDDILHIILTGVTSGKGLGYNRAAALLIDEERSELVGAHGIGATLEEVGRVWKDAAERFRTLEDHFTAAEDEIEPNRSPFHQLVRSLRVSLLDRDSYFSRVISGRRWFNVRNAGELQGQDRRVAETLRSAAFAIVPIWTKDLVIGVILVDNCYNRRPIRDEDLELLQTIANQCGMALDAAGMVSQLSAAMSKLEEMTERVVAAERLAAVGEVAAGVAHDIRNPLTAIGGFTRRLAKRLPPTDVGHRYVEIIEHEVVRLEKLAREVLELAIVREKHIARLDLLELARQWRRSNEARLAARGVEIRIDSTPLLVEADPMLAEQAVVNILNNAIESIEKGGVIRCTGEKRPDQIRLAIQDTGCGMTAEETACIFDAFYTRKTEGTGLGLALARKAIRSHGGEIEAASEPNKGTVMTIILPPAPGG